MQFSVSGTFPAKSQDCLILLTTKKPDDKLDENLKKLLAKFVKEGDFSGDKNKSLLLHNPEGLTAKRLLLFGIGEKKLANHQQLEILSKLAKQVLDLPVKELVVLGLNQLGGDEERSAQLISQAFVESSYRITRFKSHKGKQPLLKKITIVSEGSNQNIKAALVRGQSKGEGVNLARTLGDLPGNICTPTYLASHARAMAKEFEPITCQVLTEKQMRELGMHSLLSVSSGSAEPAKLIIIKYLAGKANEKPIALVGKGVTFDSGGISLKPGAAMDEMKYDMCGAASVLGTIKALALGGEKTNVIGIIPAVENMPSGNATKPGDVVKSMSGQTIEILNTDAEGRLILCDALTYAQRFKPRCIIDIATLTGACIVALGSHAHGLFSNDDQLAEQLLTSGIEAGDRAWRLPVWEEYDKQLDSNFADMANIGGPKAGSVTAACFLARFTKGQRWAHLDIAGTSWITGANKGGTGRPVPLLLEFILNQADK